MSSINFVLDAFNCEVTLDISASLFKYPFIDELDVDATAIYFVDLNDMRNTFKYQTDANDVVNEDSSDLKYLIDIDHWVNMNPATAQMGHFLSRNPINSYDSRGNQYPANAMLVYHDFIRYLSLKIFNSPYGVDLFYNKPELDNHIRFICGDSQAGCAWFDLTKKLEYIGKTGTSPELVGDAGSRHLTNAVSDENNICRHIIQILLTIDPGRFSTIEDTTLFQPMPFRENDSINFKLILRPNDFQNQLTGVAAIPPRSYGIKLIMTNSPVNVEVNPDEL
jgi:hypothetical protein